jgi:hypothetical protein
MALPPAAGNTNYSILGEERQERGLTEITVR